MKSSTCFGVSPCRYLKADQNVFHRLEDAECFRSALPCRARGKSVANFCFSFATSSSELLLSELRPSWRVAGSVWDAMRARAGGEEANGACV